LVNSVNVTIPVASVRWRSCANKKRGLLASYHFAFATSYSLLLLLFILRLFIIVSSCLPYPTGRCICYYQVSCSLYYHWLLLSVPYWALDNILLSTAHG